MPNGMYGGVRGRRTKVGRKLLRFPPTRLEGRGTALAARKEPSVSFFPCTGKFFRAHGQIRYCVSSLVLFPFIYRRNLFGVGFVTANGVSFRIWFISYLRLLTLRLACGE